jgi:hypothetical protein
MTEKHPSDTEGAGSVGNKVEQDRQQTDREARAAADTVQKQRDAANARADRQSDAARKRMKEALAPQKQALITPQKGTK